MCQLNDTVIMAIHYLYNEQAQRCYFITTESWLFFNDTVKTIYWTYPFLFI